MTFKDIYKRIMNRPTLTITSVCTIASKPTSPNRVKSEKNCVPLKRGTEEQEDPRSGFQRRKKINESEGRRRKEKGMKKEKEG